MQSKLNISRQSDKIKSICAFIAAILIFIVCTKFLELDLGKFISRLSNAGNVLKRLAVVDFNRLSAIFSGMMVSVSIAIAALVVGFVISIMLSFLSASNTAPNQTLAAIIKATVAVVRAVPALVWILMVVASTGFGSTGGMIGMTFPTVGYLTKSFIASIEEQGYNTIEAMRATGASWLNIISKGLIPNLITPFISWIAIRAEGNIAESINLGMVGVAGIGSILMRAIGKYDYAGITTIILVIFITMVIVEIIVNKIKKAIKYMA